MRPSGVLIDAGPLVAYLNRRDHYHDWAVDAFDAFSGSVLTCEPVLTEACFLVGRGGLPGAKALDFVARGAIKLGLQIADELGSIRQLMERYANVPMSLADACLVRLAELTDLPICTLDGDFYIYRAHGRRTLNLIAPASARSLHES